MATLSGAAAPVADQAARQRDDARLRLGDTMF
jgi:hypothetical protein